jgi:5-methyltetrahydrofolate--homocysteine methyltransferase
VNPLDIIEKGLRPSLDYLGKEFEEYRVALPELVVAGDIATEMGRLVEEALLEGQEIPMKGSIAIGTVKGDIHSIGKNIVGVMMKAYGFKVIDLGADVSPEEFMEVASEVDALGLSGLLTLATRSMKETVAKVVEKYPEKIIIAGGAAMDTDLADRIGVHYGPDAASGVRILEKIIMK